MLVQKELKNWYIWEYVEPIFNYSYDFRNKTTSDLSTDWWLNTSWLTTWSDWITSSSWIDVRRSVSWLTTALSTAKKLRLEAQTYIQYTWSCVSWLVLTEWLDYTKQCWFYYDANWFSIEINGDDNRTTHVKSTGVKNITVEYDFENKTYSGDYVGGNGTFSWTITDTQIAGVRNLGYIYMPLERYSYIQTISITIY